MPQHVDATLPSLEWKFEPLAFDTYGAPAPDALSTLDNYAHILAWKAHIPVHLARRRIHQRLSFIIWSSTAEAIPCRDPTRDTASVPLSQI